VTTYMANSETIERKWLLIDARDKTLGRLASQIAHRLRGKHRAEFTPHADTGDFVVVINAETLQVTGKKEKKKFYHHHTGYVGSLKTTDFSNLQAKKPGRVLELAVKGMLPKGPLGRQMFRKLKVYSGSEHPHQAQNPELLVTE
jgi:large subunit ribosomal protein L13